MIGDGIFFKNKKFECLLFFGNVKNTSSKSVFSIEFGVQSWHQKFSVGGSFFVHRQVLGTSSVYALSPGSLTSDLKYT